MPALGTGQRHRLHLGFLGEAVTFVERHARIVRLS
jgi:hypothetical protein